MEHGSISETFEAGIALRHSAAWSDEVKVTNATPAAPQRGVEEMILPV